MAKSSGPPPIVFILLFLLLAGAGYWWFFIRQPASTPIATDPTSSPLPPPPPPAPIPGGTPISTSFPFPSTVPAGTTVRIDGSTSMVTINQTLKNGFQSQYPGTTIATQAGGTEKGLQDLRAGAVEVAAVSRPLTAQEQAQGLVAIPVASDQIALVVGNSNPFTGGLTSTQVVQIFSGTLNNWLSLGGNDSPIQVINRPPISGTHQTFKEIVLKGSNFGTTPNIQTLSQDTTTLLLRELGNNGIGYATYAQVVNQQTVRVVPIDGVNPGTPSYPYQRQLYYVYKNPPTPATQAFLGYATSPQGQQAMLAGQ